MTELNGIFLGEVGGRKEEVVRMVVGAHTCCATGPWPFHACGRIWMLSVSQLYSERVCSLNLLESTKKKRTGRPYPLRRSSRWRPSDKSSFFTLNYTISSYTY